MTKGTSISVGRRFTRSARIDSDLNDLGAIEGFVLQPSVRSAFETMAAANAKGRQSAFTWTGPYGGGKSSAALVYAQLLAGNGPLHDAAVAVCGKDLANRLGAAFGRSPKGWRIVALSGRRGAMAEDLRGALGLGPGEDPVTELVALSKKARHDGVLLLIDELGKYLEHGALEGGDLHILQDIAELGVRSEGRLLTVGILHQSFERYAARLPRAIRDEWAKIQGRFQDIVLANGAEESIDLIARAISGAEAPASAVAIANRVAGAVQARRGSAGNDLSDLLARCWPLHPVVAMLLGPISRQRFGQNERSVFGFLASAEPSGFQDYLASNMLGSGYLPAMLFDYLSANLGAAILASGDGHRFSTSLDAIDRAAARGSALHVVLAKCATLIEMFGLGTGIAASAEVLAACVPDASEKAVSSALEDLTAWSVLVHRKHLDAFAVFAGSDFDLDAAVSAEREAITRFSMAERVLLPAVVAKRHYHRTGCLRWSDVLVYPLPAIEAAKPGSGAKREAYATAHRAEFDSWRGAKAHGAALVLALQPAELTEGEAEMACRALARREADHCVAVGLPRSSYLVRELAVELETLERVAVANPQIEGDAIARREVQARIADVAAQLEQEIRRALSGARWFAAGARTPGYDGLPMSAIASSEADLLFSQAPLIGSELINRDRPSSNVMAAVRSLLHAMVAKADVERMGIEGYPQEYALYASTLKEAGLHREGEGGAWQFCEPGQSEVGQSYAALWEAAEELPDGSSLADLFARWSAAPIGLRAGPMPIFALAWLLARERTVAVYLDGYFVPSIDDVVADRLLQNAGDIAIRRVDLGRDEDALVHGLAKLASGQGVETPAVPLSVAKSLVRIVATLPNWAKRSRSFDHETRRVRDLILHADDPHALLFDEFARLGSSPGECVDVVAAALAELCAGYDQMLEGLGHALAAGFGCDAGSFAGLGVRVAAIHGVVGDLRLDAFAQRVAGLEGASDRRQGLESLGSFLVHRPTAEWTDQDVDRAHAELVRFVRRMREAEVVAVERGRASGAEALSVIRAGRTGDPVVTVFELSESEANTAQAIADSLAGSLSGIEPNLAIGAIAEVLRRIEAEQGASEAVA